MKKAKKINAKLVLNKVKVSSIEGGGVLATPWVTILNCTVRTATEGFGIITKINC